MPCHIEQQYSPYTPQQLFDMVSDVAKYPEFLPWCRAARILQRRENEFLGELVISFAHLTESYVSRVVLNAPHAIDVTLVRGPFEYLSNQWRFSPATQGGTMIDFQLDFKFRSKMLEKLIGGLFARATQKMVDAFQKRADALYGPHAR